MAGQLQQHLFSGSLKARFASQLQQVLDVLSVEYLGLDRGHTLLFAFLEELTHIIRHGLLLQRQLEERIPDFSMRVLRTRKAWSTSFRVFLSERLSSCRQE